MLKKFLEINKNACIEFSCQDNKKFIVQIFNAINANDSLESIIASKKELAASGEVELKNEENQYLNFFSDKRIKYSLAGMGAIILGYWVYNKYFENKKENQKK